MNNEKLKPLPYDLIAEIWDYGANDGDYFDAIDRTDAINEILEEYGFRMEE